MTAIEIKVLRHQLGLTQEQLAALLLVSVETVQRWEQGRTHPLRGSVAAMERMAKKEAKNDEL